jgi:hypothetical protein
MVKYYKINIQFIWVICILIWVDVK